MAESKELEDRADGSVEGKKDALTNAQKIYDSVTETIKTLEDFETRWKEVNKGFGEVLSLCVQQALGQPLSLPPTLSEDEKMAVLDGKPTLGEICKRLKNGHFKRVIVMVGAGISVSAGIPDFRSPGSGLYDSLDLQEHGLPSPQAVFEIDFFRQNPRPFFSVVKQLISSKFKPTTSHFFVKLLADRGLLLRCYTQNIDGLERATGLQENDIVEAHGCLATAKCTSCSQEYSIDQVRETIMKDDIPKCSSCKENAVIKPNIVFFRENLPERFKEHDTADFSSCDLLIVMGTSLQVQPFAALLNRVKATTPRLLVNKERVGELVLQEEGGYRDVAMIQDCDSAVEEICRQCGWSSQLKALVAPPAVRETTHVRTPVNKKQLPNKSDHHH